jgi:hypothetical protein
MMVRSAAMRWTGGRRRRVVAEGSNDNGHMASSGQGHALRVAVGRSRFTHPFVLPPIPGVACFECFTFGLELFRGVFST